MEKITAATALKVVEDEITRLHHEIQKLQQIIRQEIAKNEKLRKENKLNSKRLDFLLTNFSYANAYEMLEENGLGYGD